MAPQTFQFHWTFFNQLQYSWDDQVSSNLGDHSSFNGNLWTATHLLLEDNSIIYKGVYSFKTFQTFAASLPRSQVPVLFNF